jgi:hypothetical protein
VPRRNDPTVEPTEFIGLMAGYIARARADLPRGGSKAPWRLRQNYLLDRIALRFSPVDDGVLQFD